MAKLELSFEGRLPGLNEIIEANRRNRFGGATMKRKNQKPLELLFRSQSKNRKFDNHVTMKVTFFEPFDKKHRRDDDNVIAGLKFIQDAIVQVGIIKDDSPKWLHVIPERIKDCKECKVLIEMEETDA